MLRKCNHLRIFLIAFTILFYHGVGKADAIQDWGIEIDETSCLQVSGIYQSSGLSSNTTESSFYTKPLLERNVFGFDQIDADDYSVQVELDAVERQLNITVLSSEGTVLASKVFNEPYSCEAGWIVYRSSSSGSGDGSYHLESNTLSKLAASNSGELIAYLHRTTISRKWLFLREEQEFEICHKFEAKK